MSDLLEIFASYVPTLALRQLTQATQPLSEPQTTQQPAAVLFADIAGFTQLAKALTEHGPQGEEQLTHILNSYFGQLIDLVATHGGEVVKFAGDGLLAIWLADQTSEAPPAALAEATQRAAQCSLAAQAALHNYAAAEQTTLTLRIGLSAGTIYSGFLGGALGRWEFLLGGEPVTQATQACGQAVPGQCVVAAAGWNLIAARCTGQPISNEATLLLKVVQPLALQPHVAPALAPALQDTLRGHLPAAVRQRLEAGQAGWMAELRRVTVLFIALPELSFRTPLPQAQAVAQTLQTVLYRYEGSINKLGVDDKGVAFLAALGLPPFSHADDPLRGVQAALAIQAALQALGTRVHIGLTTGRAFCGSVGNTRRREYTLLGDTVNVAARLMQKAAEQGQAILCDEPTYQATHSQVDFETLAPLTLKGQPQPLATYRPMSSKSAPKAEAPPASLVGRAAEQAQLTESLAAVQNGASRIVLIEGEAGIGKSRLVAELQAQATALGIRCLAGEADAIERTTAYQVWRTIFGQVLAADTWPTEAAARREHAYERVQALLGANAEALILTPLLSSVLPVDLPENAQTQQLQGEGRANKTNNWLSQLLQKYGNGQPLVLILEDAQWLDSASWALARLVSLDVQPLLLVLVTRPLTEPLPSEYRHFLNQPQLQHIKLENLPPTEAMQLVCARLGVRALPEVVANFIRERGEGHPFFSEELAYALRDAKMIQIVDDECRIAPGVDFQKVSLPNTVQGVIAGRIDKLPPQEQLTLKVASVIGRLFALSILREVHPIQADIAALPNYLQNLNQLEITRLETPPPTPSYLFKHVITQQVAYDLMLFEQRRHLHRAVAEWYEQTYAADLQPYYALLAYHWQKAEVLDKAVTYLLQAGEQTKKRGAYAEAIAFFTLALTLEPQLATRPAALQRAQRLYALAEAHYDLGQMPQSQTILQQVLALLNLPLPASGWAWGWGILQELGTQAWQRQWPQPLTLTTEEQAARRLAAQAHHLLMVIGGVRGEKLPTLYSVFRGVNLAEAGGPSAVTHQAHSYGAVGSLFGLLAFRSWADFYVQRSTTLLPQIQDLDRKSALHLTLGVYWEPLGDWAQTDANLAEAARLGEQTGQMRRWEEASAFASGSLCFQSQFPAAQTLATNLYQVAVRQGDDQAQGWSLALQARCALRQGRTNEALTQATQAAEKLAVAVDKVNHFAAQGLMLSAQARLAQWEAAQPLATRMLAQLKGFDALIVSADEGYRGLAYYHLASAEQNPAAPTLQAAQTCCRHLQQFARTFGILQPVAEVYAGWHEQLAGRPQPAQQRWAKALTLAQRYKMPYEEGLAHYHWGRFLPATDPTRQTHLKEALAIFERLGAAWDVEQTQARLKGA